MFRTSSKEEKVTSLSSVDLLSHLELLKKSKFKEMFGEINLACQLPEWTKIKDIGEVVSGATPNTGNDEFWNGSFKWITPAEIDKDAFWIDATERTLTQVGIDSKNLKLLPKGTVLLTSRAPIGKVALANCEMCSNQGFKNIICSEQIDPVFLYFLLKNNTPYLNSLGRGATFKEVSKEIVENIKIPVPPIQKQSAFISFINHIEKIKQTIQLILAKLELLKKSLYREYFGNPYETLSFVKLGTLGRLITGGTPSRKVSEYYGGTIPFLSTPSLGSDFIDEHSIQTRLTNLGVEKSSTHLIPPNSLLIGIRVGVGKSSINKFEVCTNQDIVSLVEINHNFNLLFLKHTVDQYRNLFEKMKRGATIQGVTSGFIKDLHIPNVPIELQVRYSKAVTHIEKIKLTLQKSLYDLTGEA